jgi:hypothetical protein
VLPTCGGLTVRRRLVVPIVTGLLTAAGAYQAQAASPYGTFPSCTSAAKGYETQAWWSPMAGAPHPGEPGHVHLGMCLPRVNSTISAPVAVDALVQLHNNPSRVKRVRWSDGSTVIQDTPQTFVCQPPQDQCQFVQTLTIDPARFGASGYRELRFTADVETRDGRRMFNTTRWCYKIVNGKSNGDYCGGKKAERFGAAGWYEGVDYMNVMTQASDYDGVLTGTRCFTVKFERSKGFASIDPRFHAVPPDEGYVLYRGDGNNSIRELCGNMSALAPGPHRVFLRTDAQGTSPAGIGSGVFTLPITTG